MNTEKVERRNSRPISTTQLGRFEIRGELGAGGMGKVYRAYDPQLRREVALKVPQLNMLTKSNSTLERFFREARAAAGLHHPHIVPVFDAGQDGKHFFIANAYIEGHALSPADVRPKDRVGDPNFRRTASVVADLADALHYAHSQGIVHRDVKPDNVLMDKAGQPFLTDFGIARITDDDSTRMTHDGQILGTPAYMSPEQAEGNLAKVGPASDQYSLGVLLYELLTNQLPFEGPLEIVLSKVRSQEPPPPRSVSPMVPKDLETICLKMMAKQPSDRFATLADTAEDLRRYLANEPLLSRPISRRERFTRWVRRNPAIAELSAMVALVLLVLAVGGSLLELESTQSQIFEIGGPEPISYGGIMREYAKQRCLPRLMVPVPVLTPTLSSRWLGLVTPVYARIGKKLIQGLRNPTVVSNNLAETVFHVKPMGIRAAIRRALQNEDQRIAETRWANATLPTARGCNRPRDDL